MKEKVCNLEELPLNTVRVVQFQKNIVAVFHRPEGFFALDERCSHRGGPLSEGEFKNETVVCPWHGAQFNLKTGACTKYASLRTYPVIVENGEVWIELPST